VSVLVSLSLFWLKSLRPLRPAVKGIGSKRGVSGDCTKIGQRNSDEREICKKWAKRAHWEVKIHGAGQI